METKPYLTLDAILEAPDRTIEAVAVPEWGGTVYVRNMTGLERDKFEASITEKRGKDRELNLINLRAKMLAVVLCDPDGHPLLGAQEPEKIKQLGEKNAGVLDRLFWKAQRLSGISKDDIESMTKNSNGDQSDASPSG